MIVKRVIITKQERDSGADSAQVSYQGVDTEGKREYGTYGTFRVSPDELATLTVGLTLKLEIE